MSLDLAQVSDIRQSEGWASYLAALGWKSHRTTNGIQVVIRPSIFGGLVKVQKPKPFSKHDLDEILKISHANGAGLIKIEPYIDQNTEILREAGFETSRVPMTPTATYLMDLTLSQDDLWANVSHSAKYSIHRAQREGARVEIIRNPSTSQIETFYKILKTTGKRKGFFVPSIKLPLAQARAFKDNGFLAFAYNKQNEITGAKWHVGNGESVLYVSGGTTLAGLDDKSGYALVWETILYFKSLGYQVFDLEGKYDARFPSMTKKWGGFSGFKEKFGGISVEFPYPYIKYVNPVLKFMHKWAAFDL